MAATDSSTGTSSLTGAWLTNAQSNAITGYPDSPLYPGPVTADHSDPGPADPGRSGPPGGTPAPEVPYPGSLPQPDLSGGLVADTQAQMGHSAQMAAYDSSAGEPFAPSGPIADSHGYDTGGTERKEHVLQPSSPGWFRRILTGQTFNRQAQVTDTAGWAQSAINGRQNLDQYQGQDADAYDPFVIPYSERPLKANFAAEAHPVEHVPSTYSPSASLPDMYALGGQGNFGYTSPPDPSVSVQAPNAAPPANTSDMGMEFLNYG